MNETELRRKKLLEQTRKAYRDRQSPPAVHPRYHRTYQSLYGDQEDACNRTIGIRLFLCVLLFALYVAMDLNQETIAGMDSGKIAESIRFSS